jgi:choline dehydrogenase-like flavoprotein
VAKVVVVGSGASGVHFALTALQRGHEVTLVDVGYQRPAPVLPHATFAELKEQLPDPLAYFLGTEGGGVVYPESKPSYYGHPPSKNYVFAAPKYFRHRARAMQPVFSFARGGLAEAWTGGSYAFSQDDLAGFPFDYGAIRSAYQEIARRIGVGAADDDLARFIPFDAPYLDPLPLDPHSRLLVETYMGRRQRLQRDFGFFLGRSRVATLSRDYAGRGGCGSLGRCLWGCPREAIYSPLVTLRECEQHEGFQYCHGLMVTHFEYRPDGRISGMVAVPVEGGTPVTFTGESYVLAAGALATSKIYLDSIRLREGRIDSLAGLMDNQQVHVPFLSPRMIGQPSETASYQFHHLAFGLPQPDPRAYIHGQITTLRAASVQPIVQGMPLDLRTALKLFRGVRTGLGIANINLFDSRRAASRLTLEPLPEGRSALVVDYAGDPDEPARVAQAVKATASALRALGCIIPPGMTRVLPKGASVHYCGTLPMQDKPGDNTCSPTGRSHRFPNLLIADGATFPFLPAKNLTFTLMANAVRIAESEL